MLPAEKGTEGQPSDNDDARNDGAGPFPSADEQKKERQDEIELIFDGERPRVRERGAAAQADVLHRDEKFPKRRYLRELAQRWEQEIDREDNKVCRQDAQGPASKEARKVDSPFARQRREQLSTDQVAAKNKEKVDTDPAKAVRATWKLETEDTGMINNDDDNGKGAEQIETRLAFAIGEAWIDNGLGRGLLNGGTLTAGSSPSNRSKARE